MSLTNPTVLLNTTFSGKNISSAASVYDYTVTQNGKINIAVKLTNAAGNGDYVVYLKRQWLGTGTASVILPKTTATAASGETVIEFQTMMVSVINTDVISVFVDGLTGDTSVNGNIQILQDNYSLLETADNIGINWADVSNPTSTVELSNTTINTSSLTATVAISATAAASVATGDIAIDAFATFAQTVTSTSTLALPGTKLWFAVKNSKTDADNDAVIFAERTAGLTRLLGAAYTGAAGDFAITVSGSSGAWSILLEMEEGATALLADLDQRYYYEVKALVSGDTYIISSGYCDIGTGIVRALA